MINVIADTLHRASCAIMAAVFRRVIAGLILGPALLIGSFAWWGFLALRTVFDENRTGTIAEELLDNEAVRDQIGDNIGKAIEGAVPDSVPLTEEQTSAAVEIILTDPVVRGLIIGSLGTTHRAFLGLDDAPSTIDLGPALVSARERIADFNPDIADQIPAAFEVDLPTERIPNASPVKNFLESVVPLLAGISVVMTLMAFLTTSDRSHVLGKAARWAMGTTVFYLAAGLGLPYLLRQFAPAQAEVLAAFLAAVLRAALIPSIVLGVIGIVLLLLSMFWPNPGDSRRQRQPARQPAAVAPHAAAPVPRAQPAAPTQPIARPAAPAPQRAPDDPTTAMPAPQRPTFDPTTAIPSRPTTPSPSPAPPSFAPPTPSSAPVVPRPTLPTRAKPPESVGLPEWTGDPAVDASTPEPVKPGATTPEPAQPKWLPPTWVEEHGWVMDADDPRQPPANARFVEGVGWVVPGPPPA